jgi:hypothetical protein
MDPNDLKDLIARLDALILEMRCGEGVIDGKPRHCLHCKFVEVVEELKQAEKTTHSMRPDPFWHGKTRA